MKSQITKANEQYFTDRVLFWQRRLGLLDWAIHVEIEKLEEYDYAETKASTEDRRAVILINSRWPEKVTDEMLDRIAFHEIFEVILDPLAVMAQVTFSGVAVHEAVHSVICRAENTIFEAMR